MSKTFIESIIPFITSMRKGISEEGGVVYPEGTEFEVGQSYDYLYYNKDLPFDYIDSCLAQLDWLPFDIDDPETYEQGKNIIIGTL